MSSGEVTSFTSKIGAVSILQQQWDIITLYPFQDLLSRTQNKGLWLRFSINGEEVVRKARSLPICLQTTEIYTVASGVTEIRNPTA
jgi:hypothetical protein